MSDHIRPGAGHVGHGVPYAPGGEPYLTGSLTAAKAAAMPVQFGDMATDPSAPPFDVIPSPDHLSGQKWQMSFYDATSQAPMGAYSQRPSGPCDLHTGQLLGEFPSGGSLWKQV